MTSRVLQELDAILSTAQLTVELGKSLERLLVNRDFKQVVLNGYLEKEAIRLVHLKAAPDQQGADQQRAILTQLDSIGCFKQYLFGMENAVEMALKAIETTEQTRDELLNEG
jgi:hypothetical protein